MEITDEEKDNYATIYQRALYKKTTAYKKTIIDKPKKIITTEQKELSEYNKEYYKKNQKKLIEKNRLYQQNLYKYGTERTLQMSIKPLFDDYVYHKQNLIQGRLYRMNLKAIKILRPLFFDI